MRVIAWTSEKGGVGKTTSAINTAVGFAKAGLRVLAIDADPQANLSLVFREGQGVKPPSLAAVLLGEVDAADAILPTRTPRLEVLPAASELADANLALTNTVGREGRLRAALDGVDGRYDVVVIDCPPTRSLLTVNALVAASEVFIPIEPTLFAMAGLGQLQGVIRDVAKFLANPSLRIGGILLACVRRDKVSQDVEQHVREAFGPLVLKSTIPVNVAVEEAHGRYMSVLDYAPKSAGAKAYQSLVTEILHGNRKARRNGTAPPAGLLHPTMQPEPADAADDASEGRGDAAPAPKSRRAKKPVSTETKGRKLHIPEDIHDRLWLLARQRKTTRSAVAADILNKGLPRWKPLERED